MLRLQDWDISIRFARVQEMDGVEHRGNVQMHADSKTAIIKILESNDYCHDDAAQPYDAEAIVVHELLHLHFLPLCGKDYNKDEEVAVNLISAALVTLNRK